MSDSRTRTVGERLRAAGLTIATAESCTGGLIAARLTDIAGSSAYVRGGIVAYTNAVKMALLGVPPEIIREHSAVSEPVAHHMAIGARQTLQADIALSATGIAGPGGGTAEKPVGLTFIGLSAPNGTWVRRFVWDGNRARTRHASVEAALQFVLDYLDGTL
ncbi:MAG: CinA family protein [Anaerolineae bacterium]|nr:CinA family protein [Anaerolineae bacterium]